MAILERVLGGNIFYDFWKQLQLYIFSEKRLMQLITLQPIEIYHTTTELEIDNAKVELEINSHLENLMQRRIDRTFDLLTLNFSGNQKGAFVYDFDIQIKAQMKYEEVSNYFNHQFTHEEYPIRDNRLFLALESFQFSRDSTKLVVEVPFVLKTKWWFFKWQWRGMAEFNGSVNFDFPKYDVRTRNLKYELLTKSFILKVIDRFYHKELITFLDGFLQYNFKEEMFHAKVEAQLEINSFQNQSNWASGNVNELELERVTLEPDGIHAVFVAKGKLQIIR
jgi:hypothetical protein